MVCIHSLALACTPDSKKDRLQIVSDVYKKQPYIQVPTAWIPDYLRSEILKTISECIAPQFSARIAYLTDKKLLETLRCHPAVSIGIYAQKEKELESIGIFLIYPKNYRGLIEDPLEENPPPILYLGSTRRLAFYYYPKDKIHPIVKKILDTLVKLNQ